MADQKLDDLTAATTVEDDDLFYLVRDPGGTPLDRKIAGVDLKAAGGGSGLPLGAVGLAGGSEVDVATGGTTPSAVHASLSIAFTVPASGRVVARLNTFAYGVPGDSQVYWMMLESGSAVSGTTKLVTAAASSAAFCVQYSCLIEGLTPGASHTWVWGHRGNYGGASGKTSYGGVYGAATFEVWAA